MQSSKMIVQKKPALIAAVFLILLANFAPRSEARNQPFPRGQVHAETPHWYPSAEWVLVIVTGITAAFICWQSWETRRAANAAKDSTAAASHNTEVLIDIERAWLIPSDDVRPKSLPTVRLRPVQTELLVVQIKNFGRTPAWITDFWIDIEVLDDTNIEQFTNSQKPEADYSSSRPVPSDKTEEFSIEWNIRDASMIDDIQAGRKHLYVFGYVQYRIAMRKELACSYFCFHYFRRRYVDGNFEEGWMLEPPTANHYS
jgi:hypothetical protein